MHELVTDVGVIRLGADGVLELFRDLDGRSTQRTLVWGCEVVVDGPDRDQQMTLTVTRKRLPVLSVKVPLADRAEAEALAAAVRRFSSD